MTYSLSMGTAPDKQESVCLHTWISYISGRKNNSANSIALVISLHQFESLLPPLLPWLKLTSSNILTVADIRCM